MQKKYKFRGKVLFVHQSINHDCVFEQHLPLSVSVKGRVKKHETYLLFVDKPPPPLSTLVKLIIFTQRKVIQKVGGRGVQLESKSFEVVLFLSFVFWTLNGERGVADRVSKVLRHFILKYWVHISVLSLYKSYLTVAKMG